MEQRKIWNEQAGLLEKHFQKAFAMNDEMSALFGEYIELSEQKKTLETHWTNWKDNRFEIVVVGEFSTGKSTFINALLCKEVLPNKVTPTTATINYVRHCEEGDGEEKAVIHFFDGGTKDVSFSELVDYVTEMSKKHRVVDEVAYVDLFVDSPYLKDGVVIVDTPGLQALHPEHERITKEQIKQSNASILLFNLEQPGKKTEFVFLKDLSGAIERIFFVGNRMDGVPDNELQEVIDSLENALKDNEYQPIPAEKAQLYPMSAAQALKGRDPGYKTKHWNDWSSEQLMMASRFPAFEERLEEYLFNGEKAKDLLKAPFFALLNFFKNMKEKVSEIEVLVSGEINVEQLESEKKRLTEEVELRKLQLQDQERTIKNVLLEAVNQHEKWFNERRVHVQEHMKSRLDGIEFIEDLADEVSSIMIDVNREIDQLVDQSLHELAIQVELSLRKEISDFELVLNPEAVETNIHGWADRETATASTGYLKRDSDWEKEIEEKYKQEEAQLEQEKQKVLRKMKLEEEVKSAKLTQDLVKESQRSEAKLHDLLLNNTDVTKKQYGVIKKRKFWFDKEGYYDVPNDRFEALVKEKGELQNRHRQESLEELGKLRELEIELKQSESKFDHIQDYYDARRELQKQKEQEKLERLERRTKDEKRQLDRERRKMVREIENIFDVVRKDYRSLLRGLDSLKLARQTIEDYIREKDLELNQKLSELKAKEQLLLENAAKQEKYKASAESSLKGIEAEQENLTDMYLQLI